MALNVDKSKGMLYGRSSRIKQEKDLRLKFDDSQLKPVSSEKLLGIHVDSMFTSLGI